jgi:hypothetical protein
MSVIAPPLPPPPTIRVGWQTTDCTDTYTIYVHCWKISNLFVPALETGRKRALGEVF